MIPTRAASVPDAVTVLEPVAPEEAMLAAHTLPDRAVPELRSFHSVYPDGGVQDREASGEA